MARLEVTGCQFSTMSGNGQAARMRLPLALRMAGNTIKRDDITYAGAEYARGFVAKRSQQTTGIITFCL